MPPDSEFDAGFLALLEELNAVVGHVGERVEGNCLYGPCDFPPTHINQKMRAKRQSLLAAAQGRRQMLEVGVNAGHSALALLYHHPQLIYHGVDICQHGYTKPAASFLKQRFGERFFFHAGNSLVVLPRIAVAHKELRFDFFHIDGGHAVQLFETDFYNCLRLAAHPAWVVVDDTNAFDGTLRVCLQSLVEAKLAAYDTLPGFERGGSELVRLIPKKSAGILP